MAQHYIDRTGKLVLGPFETAHPFAHGLAGERRTRNFGFIDLTGKQVIRERYKSVRMFDAAGLAPFQTGRLHQWGYIDRTGREAIAPRFGNASGFVDGVAAVSESHDAEGRKHTSPRRGTIATTGEWIVPPGRYADVGGLACGRSLVRTGASELPAPGDRYGFVDREGRVVVEPRFADAWPLCEERAWVRLQDNRFAVVDPDGRTVFEHPYARVMPYHEGLAAFLDGDKWGFLDREGAVKIPPRFDAVGPAIFSHGLAAANVGAQLVNGSRVGGRWGFVDTSGAWAIEPRFENPLVGPPPFANGVTPVLEARRWRYVDTTGATVIEGAFEWANPFGPEGLAVVALPDTPAR